MAANFALSEWAMLRWHRTAAMHTRWKLQRRKFFMSTCCMGFSQSQQRGKEAEASSEGLGSGWRAERREDAIDWARAGASSRDWLSESDLMSTSVLWLALRCIARAKTAVESQALCAHIRSHAHRPRLDSRRSHARRGDVLDCPVLCPCQW